MTSREINCFLFIGGFLSFGALATNKAPTHYYDWSLQPSSERKLLPASQSSFRFNCSLPLGNNYTDILDIYSTNCHGYTQCNATYGKLIGSLKCGEEGETLDIDENEGRTYFLIGFARKKSNPEKPILSGGTCKSNQTKLRFHICDSSLAINGTACNWEDCPLPLGLEDGRIKDKLISASSELDKGHTAKKGRISYRKDYKGAWCAGPTSELKDQYLQVDFNASVLVSAVATQGTSAKKSWVSRYMVHYSWDGSEWIVLTDSEGEIKEFSGNNDGSSVIRHWLKPRFNARFVRFVPLLWTGQLCMRVEVYGCKGTVFPSIETVMKNLTKGPRFCSKYNCAHIPHSMCLKYNGKQHCKCIQSCTRERAEICGSNGRTYRNKCELKREACLTKKKNVYVAKPGPCKVSVSTTCDKECPPHSLCMTHNGTNQTCECIEHCHKMYVPVCGSDGKTYKNYCLLKKIACENNTKIKIIHHGNCKSKERLAAGNALTPRCNNTKCPPYARCKNTANGIRCTCPRCLHSGEKVCGSDGKTYRDSCVLRRRSCREKILVKVVRHGCSAPRKVLLPIANRTEIKKEEKKKKKKIKKEPINYLKTFFVSMAFVAALGVVIAIGMCICRPRKSKKTIDNESHYKDKRQRRKKRVEAI